MESITSFPVFHHQLETEPSENRATAKKPKHRETCHQKTEQQLRNQNTVMADSIISTIAERVTAIIEDQIRYEINLVRGVEKEVLDLSDKLQTLRNVLDDAEKRGATDESVKRWLRKLEDTAYEVDGILDEWNYALLKRKFEDKHAKQKVCCSRFIPSCSCFKNLSVCRDTAKKIENVKAKLDHILKEKDEFKFIISLPATDHVSRPWRLQSTSEIDLEKVHGKDVDLLKNEIVSKLMIDNEPQILSIVGLGGIGKTTLAQLVYNDSRVNDCFDKSRIWICVSDPFDVAGIARGIVEIVTKETISANTNQLEVVLQKLKDSVSGKKFLLVLDDVWTEDYTNWEPLKIILKCGAPSSKILVTTRNERVARMMGTSDNEIYRPHELTDDECWSILRHISLSGMSDEECRKFEDVGMKMASKCKGLPLAVIVLGSHLRFKISPGDWENVLESDVWLLEKVELDLFPHLVLSYNELSPALKRCFSHCAIFPKDSVIFVQDLIDSWMALGYLDSDSGNGGMEIKGREYFNNLAMRSLFQDFGTSQYSKDEIKWCQMHDIVHDFAQFLREIKDTRVEARGMRKKSCQVCSPSLVSQAREYRSLMTNDEESLTKFCSCFICLRALDSRDQINGIENFIHLRMLRMVSTVLSKEEMEKICKLYFLQTLTLKNCSIKEIPKEVENLVQLRKLVLSVNEELEELPESVCSLLQLQTLIIEGCSSLRRLPEGMHRLQNLKHLIFDRVKVVLPQGVGQLSGLRTLSGEFQAGSGWNKLGLLNKLNRLTGSLSLVINKIRSNIEMEELVKDAGEAELKKKENILKLSIEFRDFDEEVEQPSPLWVDLIEALEPNNNLKRFHVTGYEGPRLPCWISSPLSLLRDIELSLFTQMLSLAPLAKLSLLETLDISRFTKLKVVGVEWLGIECSSSSSATVAFPKLKKLKFWTCHKWEEWEDITAEEEESSTLHIMPSLTHLHINNCSVLQMLPHRLLSKARSLQVLHIMGSEGLIKCYGDKDGDPWRSISQFHPQLQLVTEDKWEKMKDVCVTIYP